MWGCCRRERMSGAASEPELASVAGWSLGRFEELDCGGEDGVGAVRGGEVAAARDGKED